MISAKEIHNLAKNIAYGSFIREITIKQQFISYNEITPKLQYDSEGNILPYLPKKIKLRGIDVYRLLGPYTSIRFLNQVKAVIPLALYLIFFQILILRQGIIDHWVISAGLIAVILGLMVFMEGLKLGLMPFSETIGDSLPKKSSLGAVLLIAFTLGIGVTFAEPAIGALQAVGKIVDIHKAPYLYAILNSYADVLVLVVGVGVGIATVLGTLRFLYGWSLKPIIYITIIPTLLLTLYCMNDTELRKIIGLAWDCGAVTTGPVTVPLVLALGIGIAAAGGKSASSLSGFGIVTLASILPITGVLLLAIAISLTATPESIIQTASLTAGLATGAEISHWSQKTPFVEIILGTRAIVPLVAFLFLVQIFVIREKLKEFWIVSYGLLLCLLGMIIFGIGLSYGLAKLGGQSGSLVPAAFTQLENVENSPLYAFPLGFTIAIFFAWVLGFGATLAEPALNALGMTVENLTNGAFRKRLLMYSVSIGVGFGITLGVLKLIYHIPLAYMLLPCYVLALIFTMFSTEEFVNIAWDSAGVTTGPITVPLVLALGLGFGNAMDATEGFGILSMASICPILSVLFTGLVIQWSAKSRKETRLKNAEVVPL